MSNEQKAQGVGHIPSGLFVVSVKNGEQMDGYLASWVQQVSFSPLRIAVAINPDRQGYDSIVGGTPFSVNIVGDHDTQYMRYFWSGYEPGTNPFAEIDTVISENETIHIKGAKSVIDCKFVEKIRPGDHDIVIAEVLDSKVYSEEAKPKVHIRKSGLEY